MASDVSENVPVVLHGQDLRPGAFQFQNTYVRLPERFYARVNPTRVAAPSLIRVNHALALSLGLDPERLESGEGVTILAGNVVETGSEPLAMAYAGHQFGHFVPQLGDGRANLIGEVVGRDGRSYDIHLKGSGRTPFSRGGDGRAAVGPVLREYVVSEAMAALGVPTTRALAAVTTGEPVFRETIFPGAILTRVAASHLRVGTFQYYAARGDVDGVQRLASYAIARHYPGAADEKKPYRALLSGVIARHASLVAQWMLLGFIHGVMNTDNTSISGETLDYGPCAFLEAYEPNKVFSSIDRHGRYAYSNQPAAAHWNLTRLAESLVPLLAKEEGGQEGATASAWEALAAFGPQFESARDAGWRRKLGFLSEREDDVAIVDDLLTRMAANRADFTLTFRRLSDAAASQDGDGPVCDLFDDPAAFTSWAARWRLRLREDEGSVGRRTAVMRAANPAFIPRNHIVQQMIDAAVQRQDFGPFDELLKVVAAPYDDKPGRERYAQPASPQECVQQTFCGT